MVQGNLLVSMNFVAIPKLSLFELTFVIIADFNILSSLFDISFL